MRHRGGSARSNREAMNLRYTSDALGDHHRLCFRSLAHLISLSFPPFVHEEKIRKIITGTKKIHRDRSTWNCRERHSVLRCKEEQKASISIRRTDTSPLQWRFDDASSPLAEESLGQRR